MSPRTHPAAVLVALASLALLAEPVLWDPGRKLGSAEAQVARQSEVGRQESGIMTNFPMLLPLAISEEVKGFRADVERTIAAVRPQAKRADVLLALVDSLVASWDRYGDRMEREHGDFLHMSRNRPYWLITTDQAADTLTDRLAPVIEAYVEANPQEKVGPVRAEWEMATEQIGVPQSRLFGFQFVELARRASEARRKMLVGHPDPAGRAVLEDANIRFLWDLVQFYDQLHGSWYDRHSMSVASEDWVAHRIDGRCDDPQWQVLLSFTAIGVDTTSMDPMTDKFMHRLVLVDPACPETVDFVFPLPHYRRMEKELNEKTDAERQEILRRHQEEAIRRGQKEQGGR